MSKLITLQNGRKYADPYEFDNKDIDTYNATVSRIDLNTTRLGPKEYTTGKIVVNGEKIDLTSTNYDCIVGTANPDALIEGGNPSASTQYYSYFQNTAAGGPRLRCSITVPTSIGYRTGDANSRLVGTVYLNANTQIASDRVLAGYLQSDSFTTKMAFSYIKFSGAAGYYNLITFGDLVWLVNTKIRINAQSYSSYSSPPAGTPQHILVLSDTLGIGELTRGILLGSTENKKYTILVNHGYKKSSVGRGSFKTQFYYHGSGTYIASGNTNINRTYITIERISL